MYINTVLGKKSIDDLGIILAHEHICCYFEPYLNLAGNSYLDKTKLADVAVKYLVEMKQKHSLCAIVDCTPTNIGRDISLLKTVSERSGVDIICSTGFYYTDEVMMARHSDEYIEGLILCDIEKNLVGSIKFAVEAEKMTSLNKKMLEVLCSVQKKTSLPLCIHTNSHTKNGTEVLHFVLDRGVDPCAVTIGHCSDSEDLGYVCDLLSSGCYAGYDRIYTTDDLAYYDKKAQDIAFLCQKGFARQILLSHDNLCFNGFCDNAQISNVNPYVTIFNKLLPALEKKGVDKSTMLSLVSDNPKNMLMAK